MDDKLKPIMGHVDFGEKGTGKKLVAVHRHEDGTMDLETDDGTIYKNCVLQSYETPKSEGMTVESIPFEISMENVKIHKDNLLKALGYEIQDPFSAKMQEKTLDSVE
jgi:hypothetical protein